MSLLSIIGLCEPDHVLGGFASLSARSGAGALHFCASSLIVSALIVAGVFFCVAISMAPLLAEAFARAGIKNLENQTAQLKEHRAKLKKKRRDDDHLIVN